MCARVLNGYRTCTTSRLRIPPSSYFFVSTTIMAPVGQSDHDVVESKPFSTIGMVEMLTRSKEQMKNVIQDLYDLMVQVNTYNTSSTRPTNAVLEKTMYLPPPSPKSFTKTLQNRLRVRPPHSSSLLLPHPTLHPPRTHPLCRQRPQSGYLYQRVCGVGKERKSDDEGEDGGV
jgi:hypothetical protein